MYPVLCMPRGMSDVLLYSVFHGLHDSAVDDEHDCTGRNPGMAYYASVSPGRSLRLLRRLRTGLPHGYPDDLSDG